MIQVICREETDIYNAYHITKAFYPSAEVTSQIEEKASNYVTVMVDGKAAASVAVEEIGEGCAKNHKHLLDTLLYRQLERQTGRSLSWGVLTGVRPVKLALQKLTDGMGQDEFVRWFGESYLVSREKSELAWQVAGREKALLDRLDMKEGYSLYVGIPFCPTVCSYCSFSSGELSAWKGRIDDYLDALCRGIT